MYCNCPKGADTVNNNDKKHKKPIIFYYLAALAVLLLLNAIVFPQYLNNTFTEVDYSTFQSMVRSHSVTQAVVENNAVRFIAVDKDGNRSNYKTNIVTNSELSALLDENGVRYGQDLPEEMSPLLSVLLSWILPIGMMIFFGRMLSRRIGGMNTMSFGKSGAKIYAEDETGKTFADVAGADEERRSWRRSLTS